MSIPIFITGIGTGVGKTLISAIVAEALQADYWKPVQAGYAPDGGGDLAPLTDASSVGALLSNPVSRVHPECYKLALPASPHLAARAEHVHIDLDVIAEAFRTLDTENPFVVVEGAGGLLVPLNEHHFMADLARRLGGRVILVSRNYLGSINHSLLTARVCRELGLKVAGWMFNDHYGDYEDEIAHWSEYPILGRVPFSSNPDAAFVQDMAGECRTPLIKAIG
jgi:dethiobiotin synthetase